MVPASEYYRSVVPILALWLVCAVLLVCLTLIGYRSWRRRSLRGLARGERGAAYSLAFTITFPLYVYLVALIIEASLLLIVKFGTVHATYAATRSAVVYRSQNELLMRYKARIAAVNAMAPFASSTPAGRSRRDADRFARDAKKFVSLPGADPNYLPDKYLYADAATSLSIIKYEFNKPDGLVHVRLTYLAPTYVPGIGRFLGQKSSFPGIAYVVPIETEVSLPDEAPRTKNGKLGIIYVTP